MTSETSSSTKDEVATHPRIIIQSDWSFNLKTNTLPADVWIEFKAGNAGISRITQNIHGVCSIKALPGQDAKVYKTSATDNFQPTDIDKVHQQLRIKIQDTDFSHTFQGPTKSFTTRGKQKDDEPNNQLDPLVNVPELSKNQSHQAQTAVRPHWFDISSGGVGLTGFGNGKITIWDIENGEVRRELRGHVEDVYVSRFFPSDFAVVSGGADMTVRIWSLDSENNKIHDTTLKGHRSRINDVLALDQQRVLSASNDGSVIQWDITKNEQINTLAQLQNNSINSISLTDSSTLACAYQDGLIRLYNLNNHNPKESLQELKIGSSISSVCYLSESNQLVYGTEHTEIGIYDIRQLDQPIHAWKEQRGRITSIVPSRDNGGILATTTDGSCFEYNKDELRTIADISKAHVTDYTGADDAILNGKIFSNRIYSICNDGLVRVYENQE